jgi:pyridoxal 5'-phosphate synthase pdxT subunit
MNRVGVLALQGDYAAHRTALETAGAEACDVRTLADIEAVEALVLPGGESTVIGGLLLRFGLMDRLIERIREGMPVFGTCAGLILLAARIDGREQPGIRLLDVSVQRNAYGRQIASFRAMVKTALPGAESFEAVFIRAPRITALGDGVSVLAEHEGYPILVRQGSIVGCTFHPELISGAAVHRWFLASCS